MTTLSWCFLVWHKKMKSSPSAPVEVRSLIQNHVGYVRPRIREGGDGGSLLLLIVEDKGFFCTNIFVVCIRVTRKHPVLNMDLRSLLLLLKCRVLQGGLEVLNQRGKFLFDGDPVYPEDGQEERCGDDDEYHEEGAGYCCMTAVLLMLLRSTLQNFHILDSLPGVIVGITVIATHLFLVDHPSGSHSQPVEQLLHLTVTPERITMKIDLTLIAAGIWTPTKHLVNLLPRLILQIPDLIEADVEISESLQAVK